MLCEKCKKKKATAFFYDNAQSRGHSIALCSECSALLKKSVNDSEDASSVNCLLLPSFDTVSEGTLLDLLGKPVRSAADTERICPVCGSTKNSMARNGKVGCPHCYVFFKDELSASLKAILPPAPPYLGITPKKHKARRSKEEKISALKNRMRSAIDCERYEEAATLRDEIRALECDV